MARPKKEKEEIICPLCGQPSDRQLYMANMETFAGRAGWHLSFQPTLHMCLACACSLNAHVQAWYVNVKRTHTYDKYPAHTQEEPPKRKRKPSIDKP